MYELNQVGENTYYIDCPSKMGVYRMKDGRICLIDSGNDKDAGKKVLKLLEANHWTLGMIINTHSHADHIGGNGLLVKRTGCPAYAAGIDRAFIESPVLEPSFLYGAYPCKELRGKFLMAQPSDVQTLTKEVLPEGMEMLTADGHSFSMTALRTDDGVWFLADCLTSRSIIEKYHISFLYDVNGYLDTLNKIEALEGRLFIPAHAEPAEDIRPLVDINREKVYQIMNTLEKICEKPSGFDSILKEVFDYYGLTMDFTQYALVGSTIRSYLACLHDKGRISVRFEENRLLWETSKE